MKTVWEFLNRGESKWLMVLGGIAVCALLYFFLSRGSPEMPQPVVAERVSHADKVQPISPALIDTDLGLGSPEQVADQRPVKRVPTREELREEFDRRYDVMREALRDADIIH